MEMAKQYRLCYVRDNIMYFTDNFKNQWGDDWDDIPYEHNAGEPYEWVDTLTKEENKERGYGHIRRIAYTDNWLIKTPNSNYVNSPYSVESINKGAISWLYHEDIGILKGGATMSEAKKWLRDVGVLWGELHK